MRNARTISFETLEDKVVLSTTFYSPDIPPVIEPPLAAENPYPVTYPAITEGVPPVVELKEAPIPVLSTPTPEPPSIWEAYLKALDDILKGAMDAGIPIVYP